MSGLNQFFAFINRRGLGLIFLIPLLACLALGARHVDVGAMLTSDSPSYLYFGADRPVGYPLFLAFIKTIGGNLNFVRLLQIVLLCTGYCFLSWAFYKRVGAVVPALIYEIILFVNPGPLLQADQIMADSLSTTCIAFFAGLMLLAWGKENKTAWIMLVVVSVFACTIRPVNIALVLACLVALFYGLPTTIGRRAVWLIFLIALTAAAHCLTPAIHHLRHEEITTSNPLARGLLQKTLFKQWPTDTQADACDGKLISQMTEPTNAYLATMPADIQTPLLHLFSGYLRFQIIIPRIAQIHQVENNAKLDPVLLCYALGRMRQDPVYFALDALKQSWRLLTYSTFVSKAQHARITAFLESHPPVLPLPTPRNDADFLLQDRALKDLNLSPDAFAKQGPIIEPPHSRPRVLAWSLALFQLLGAGILLYSIGRLCRGAYRTRDAQSLLPIVGAIGIAFFGEILITSIIEIAMPRYIFPLWPFLSIAVAASALALAQRTSLRRFLS